MKYWTNSGGVLKFETHEVAARAMEVLDGKLVADKRIQVDYNRKIKFGARVRNI